MSSATSIAQNIRQEIQLQSNEESACLFGHQDEFLKMVERCFSTRIVARSNRLLLQGEPQEVALVREVFEHLLAIVRKECSLEKQQVQYVIDRLKQGEQPAMNQLMEERILETYRKKVIRPRNLGQKRYIDAIRNNTMVFGIGPAGTGKTFLAMASAISALNQGQVTRIVLTRPAVEAGESLGFLPGDILEKINPYLRPLYDALYTLLDPDKVKRFMERGVIEIAPLAFMRGRTLNSAFVILDEAQNTTTEQMKMFLTRLGSDSRSIITGDITQVDLPNEKMSGLVEAAKILTNIEDIEFVWFSKADVVRHPVVQNIINAYEQLSNNGS